jgi:hypothetical protein
LGSRLAKVFALTLLRGVRLAQHEQFSINKTERVWISLILIVVGCFYFWTATSAGSKLTSSLQKDDLYNRLADGFLAGQLSFVETPNPALAQLSDPWDPAQNGPLRQFHDVTYYRGKYYLYFGAVPAVLLLAPWKAVTGTYLPQNVAAAIFAWFGVVASMGVVLVLRWRFFPRTAGWVVGLCLIAVALGNFVPILLRRPVYYELAISSAYAFSMLAVLSVVMSLGNGRWRRRWLVLAGLAYGLAVGSRPNLVFGAILLASPLLHYWRAWRGKVVLDKPSLRRDICAIAIPFLAVIALLLTYNYLRFGSFVEFGTSYMFAGLHPVRDVVSSFWFIPVNLWYYVLAPAQISAFFPFFQVIHMPWFEAPAGYIGQENVYGILPSLPFLWMLYFVRRMWLQPRENQSEELRDFIIGILAMVGLNALVLCRISGATSRYLVDLLPPLLSLGCIGVFWAEQNILGSLARLGLRMAWCVALVWTVLFNVFVSLQHNELLRYHNPATYQKIAHAFNHVSVWFGQTSPTKVGPLLIRLKLPQERTGKLEPLIVTGLSFRADFLYFFYTDEHHIQIGFEHTSYGGPMTEPLEIDYSKEHSIQVEMGAFYPPLEHPYYDGMDAKEITRRKRTLSVVLDGRQVLSGTYDFYDSSPGDVSVGRNPVSEAFGRRFTGKIIELERPPKAVAR